MSTASPPRGRRVVRAQILCRSWIASLRGVSRPLSGPPPQLPIPSIPSLQASAPWPLHVQQAFLPTAWLQLTPYWPSRRFELQPSQTPCSSLHPSVSSLSLPSPTPALSLKPSVSMIPMLRRLTLRGCGSASPPLDRFGNPLSDGYLGFFHFGAITNHAAMIIHA